MVQLTRRELLVAGSLAGIAASVGWAAPASASKDPFRHLSRAIRGRLVLPGNPRYAGLATPRNLRFAAMMPKAVVMCADADDVAQCVLWARETGTPFAIRGGGHNYSDASSSTGIIISTRAMKRGSIDGATLNLQAGALNADLAALLSQGGAGTHLLPGGTCPNVGVAGVTLGGGIGPNAPWAGLTTDHLRAATMVTADGDIVTASGRRNADLFWALRGGAGGNFGVVTDLVYDLVEVPVARATTFTIDFPAEAAIQAGLAWQDVRRGNEERIGSSWTVSNSRNGVAARVRAQVLLPEADARVLMAPLLAIPGARPDVTERSWWETYAWYTTPISPSNTFRDRSLFADQDLDAATIERAVGIVQRFPSPADSGGSFGLSGWVGGRVSSVAPDATAYVHRGARSLIEIRAGWPNPVDPSRWPTPVPAPIDAWLQELWDASLPASTGQCYQNFPDPGLADPDQAYYGANLRRLRRVKAEWDPDNVFRYGQSIRPAAKSA